MPGQDALRKFYPWILSITLEDVERLSQDDPEVHFYLMGIYHDLLRAKNRIDFEGWRYHHNPFASMDLTGWRPPAFTDVMQIQYNMTLRANEWFGIGVWSLAEEYYTIAIVLALVSNDVIATLQNGANLALCYLGANDCNDTLRICDHLLPVATQTRGSFPGSNVSNQVGTVLRWCFVKMGKYDLAIQETHRLKEALPEIASLDQSIFHIVDDVFQTIGDTPSLENWRREWRKLQDLVKEAETTW